jgi:hypothetical protein
MRNLGTILGLNHHSSIHLNPSLSLHYFSPPVIPLCKTTMPSPLIQFLKDLKREKLTSDSDTSIVFEDAEVEIFNDNPRVHRRKRFSFCKADKTSDKASQRWGEESQSQSDMSGGLPRNSLNALVLRKSGEGHSSSATDTTNTNKDTLLSKGGSSMDTCNCGSHHCPHCRKIAMSDVGKLPPLISVDVIDVSVPGERWEQLQLPSVSTSSPSATATATATKTFQEPLQQSLVFQDLIDDHEALENDSHDIIPGLRLSSSSFSSMSSLPDIPQRKLSVTATTAKKNLFEHLQPWRNISLSEEESGASRDSRDIPDQADLLPGSTRSLENSASSMSLPNVPKRQSSVCDLKELAYELEQLEQLQDSEESSSSSLLSAEAAAEAAAAVESP